MATISQYRIIKHQNLEHDRIRRKRTTTKQNELDEAVKWCISKGCRGYKAVKSGLFPSVKCGRTINRRLDGRIKNGEEKGYCQILTPNEEETLYKYIRNKSRCLQGLNKKEVAKLVLNILHTRKVLNKRGGRKHIPLSKNAKSALLNKKVSRSFFRRFRAKYPKLKLKHPQKVDVNRGLNCSKEMAVKYIDDLAQEINDLGIGILSQQSHGVWKGTVDLNRLIGHDETPQMINNGSSGRQDPVFGISGESCERLIKRNR